MQKFIDIQGSYFLKFINSGIKVYSKIRQYFPNKLIFTKCLHHWQDVRWDWFVSRVQQIWIHLGPAWWIQISCTVLIMWDQLDRLILTRSPELSSIDPGQCLEGWPLCNSWYCKQSNICMLDKAKPKKYHERSGC